MYKSPIDIIYGQMETQMEGDILRAVQKYGINVDKEELIRALQYDREQYNKGYADAKAELVRCKDCKHCKLRYPEKQIDKEATPGWYCKEHKSYRRPDDFCSYGERREGE